MNISWDTIPPDYAASLETLAPGFTDAAAQAGDGGDAWWESALRALPTLIMADHQRDLLQIQLERARQGLPPLDSSQYGVGVSVGLDPQLKTALIVGGAILVGLAIFSTVRRR